MRKRLWCFLVGLISWCAYAQEMQPPVLLFPETGDTIRQIYPNFSWSPCCSSDPARPARYQIRIVELLGNQTPEGAIQANPAHFTNSNLFNTAFAYPFTAPVLKNNRLYAWQVTATYEYTVGVGEAVQRKVATVASEVFHFSLQDDMADAECVPMLYAQLDDRFYVVEGELQFELPEGIAGRANQLDYSLYDLRNNVLAARIKPNKKAKKNQYGVDLKQYDEFRKRAHPGKFYILEAKTPEGVVYRLRFSRRK